MVRTPLPREKIKIKRLAVGDRAFVAAKVLRVLSGDQRPLLVLIDASALKLVINASWIVGGDKVHGGDPVTLIGTVTRIGDLVEDNPSAPVSLSIDGYSQSRVTVPARSVGRVN